ncbi:MAG: hypothetical protein KDD33_01340 [Bdellovibrionales bacterium]|nr:hypothetical protein [Bdellovibrionales bacterium]
MIRMKMPVHISLFVAFSLLFISCGKEQGDVLSLASETSTSIPYLVIAGSDGNHRGFAFYTTDGEFIRGGNFRAETATPRGLVALDSENVYMSLDTTDSIYQINLDGSKTLFHGSAQFSGTIYDLAIGTNGNVYATENNRIEVFDASGIRLGSDLIDTNTGACTLNSPRGMLVNASGQLVVANAGGADEILTYDISTSTATCVSHVSFGNNPYGILLHSDGYLYVTTQGDDRVYRADPDGSNPVIVWDTDTSIINDPTGIVELPNGDLLVASSATDSIERITTTGERVGTEPFIRDVYSLNIADMVIIGDISSE